MLVPKTPITRSEPYRRYGASLPCYRCGIEGYSQAAHADAGKGMGIKTDDLTVYPLCAAHFTGGRAFLLPGCHDYVGRSMGRDERRAYEIGGAAWTQDRLIQMSQEDKKLRTLLLKLGVL